MSHPLDPPTLGKPSRLSGKPGRLEPNGSESVAAYRFGGGDAADPNVPGRAIALRAACIAGVAHRAAGLGSDDAFSWQLTTTGVAAAIADGVGTTSGARAAAQLAASEACRVLAGAEPRTGASDRTDDVRRAVAAAGRAVEESRGGDGDGATTLVVAFVPFDGHSTIGGVGDSTAFLLCARESQMDERGDDARGEWHELFRPASEDDMLSTATEALPAPAPVVEVVDVDPGQGSAIVLMTDGIAGPLRDGPETVAPAFAEMLRKPPSLLGLGHLLDFSRKGCLDDRTLLGLWRLSS